jgi:hypothetical protein
MSPLQQQVETLRPMAEVLCERLRVEAAKLGFPAEGLSIRGPDTAVFRLERDPASGSDSLLGEWLDARGYRIGMLLFHGDGSFFAEHDIVRQHPTDPRWFVEAVNVWGRNGVIRAEPRLIAMVD